MKLYLLTPDEKIEALLNDDVYGLNMNLKIADNTDDTNKLNKIWVETLSFQLPSINISASLLDRGKKILTVLEDGSIKMFTIYSKTDEIKGNIHLTSIEAYNSAIWELYNTVSQDYEWNNPRPEVVFRNIFNNTSWQLAEIDLPYQEHMGDFSIGRGNKQASLDAALTHFKCEIKTRVEIEDGVIKKYVHIVEKIGRNINHRFEYRHNVKGLSRAFLDTDFYTRLYVYGGTPEGASEPVDLKPVNNGSEYITDYEANDKWNDGNKVIEAVITNDNIVNAAALLAWSKRELEYYNHPKYQYTVDAALFDIKPELGDTVSVVDFEMNPVLTVQARVIEVNKGHEDSIVIGEFTTVEAIAPDSFANLQAQINAAKGQLAALGKDVEEIGTNTITQANTPPQDPKDGQLWLDTATQPYIIYRYDAATNEWTTLNETPDAIHVSDTEPENPYNNQLWLNTNSTPEELLRWDAATNTWTPTFESTESIIEAVSQSSQIQSLFNQKADKTELDTLATVDEVNDKIGQVQQQVGSVVSSIDNRVQPLENQVGSIETRLEAMPGELALKFASNSAGINLLKNSIGFAISSYYYHDTNGQVQQNKDIDFWSYGINELATQAQYGLVISDPDNEGYGSLWSSAPNPSQSAKAYQAVSNLIVGDKYSISGLFRKDRATDVSLLRAYYRNASGVMVQIGATIGLTNVSSEWKVATQTFVAPSTQIYVQFEIKSYERGKTAITGLMLNKGDIPYGWTPASDELYATGISFNVNGIKVQTDTNFTQMTAREFAGYAQTETGETERIFSLNGDTTEVANLQAQYEIRMGNIKIRNVNESSNKGWSFLGN